jgi:hypothetical protein
MENKFSRRDRMLTAKQKKAVRLMFQMTDDEVAREVGVTPETVALWRRRLEFAEALASEERAIRAAASRIAAGASLEAARRLRHTLEHGGDKALLDVLKASGAFQERAESAEEAIEAVIAQSVREGADG